MHFFPTNLAFATIDDDTDWFDAKFNKTECDLTIHLLSFDLVSTQFWQNEGNERLRNKFWAILQIFHFVYYLQNGEKFAFKTKFWEALRQFNLTQNQESIWPMNRVIQNLQCVKCAGRFILQGNGLLLVTTKTNKCGARLTGADRKILLVAYFCMKQGNCSICRL